MLKNSYDFENILKGIRKLYKFLISYAELHSHYDNLKEQIEYYLLFMLMSVSGGVVLDSTNKIDFVGYEKSIQKGKIVIYGAGTVGQHLYSRLKQFDVQDLSIVKWIDPDYLVYREHGLEVDSIDSLYETDFDLVIIAMMNKIHNDDISKIMIDREIPAEKISEIKSISKSNVYEILRQFEIIRKEE